MATVREAVQAAIQYVNDFAELMPLGGVRLEETDIDEESGDWLVTLSFVENPLSGARSFKMFQIDRQTNEVKAMRKRGAF